MNKVLKRSLLIQALKISTLSLILGTTMSYAEDKPYTEESRPLASAPQDLPAQTFLVGSWTGQTTGKLVQKAIYPSQGIYRLRLNSDGTLLPLDVLKISSPSWIVFSHDYKFAYTTNENEKGSVTALQVSPEGKLKTLNEVDSHGQHPTHASITADGKYLLAANYSVGPDQAGFSVFPIQADGSLGNLLQHVPLTQGSHAVPDRQASGHAHSVNISPDGKLLFVADLGADVVHAYHYDASEQPPFKAAPQFDLHFKPGEGPRHMTFSKDGKFAYVSTEMSAKVHVFAIEKDKLAEIQTLDLTASAKADEKSGAGILFSPDGKFLYIGNRGEANEIAVFKADLDNGKLSPANTFSAGGIEPRAFAFDKTGQYLLIANVYSNNIVELRRDAETGALTPTGVTVQIGTPTDIKFLP